MGKNKSNEKCKKNSNCCSNNDCLCDLLKDFKGNEVTVRTKSGDMITGTLQKVKKGCVKILEPAMMTPFVNARLTVVRCKDIESFSVDLLDTTESF
ncbi:hypothetical protein [Bacillus sp. USDA818B3_A]|uniref:hypothetical protein n=1 Tax=Bacillus sp. USDA818B3_A TaxID=2698834 RepID=UPI00136BF387|nr:hypothetical protein [Bacillus sp. USDA818B3_A]